MGKYLHKDEISALDAQQKHLEKQLEIYQSKYGKNPGQYPLFHDCLKKADSYGESYLEVLREKGVQEFNRQLAYNRPSSGSVSMAGLDLHGMDLRGIHLIDVCLSGANLEGADFSGSPLAKICLAHANCKRAKFLKSSFIFVLVDNTDFTGADFSGAYISSVNLSSAKTDEAVFENMTLTDIAITFFQDRKPNSFNQFVMEKLGIVINK